VSKALTDSDSDIESPRPRRMKRRMASGTAIATAHDVAVAAGVSTASVSRALNAPDSVRPEVRDRVVRAVAELGYVRNGAGRALASLRSGVIGAVVPCLADGVHDRILAALETGLRSSGYVLAVAVAGPADAAEQTRKLLSLGVEGIVSVGADSPDVRTLADIRKVPCIEIVADSPTVDDECVGMDFTRAAMTVARYLHGLGHRRFAVFGGPAAASVLWAGRHAALQRAMAALAGVAVIEVPVMLPTFDLAAEVASRLVRQPLPPTAIVCADDLTAAAALRGCEHAGAVVPRDASVTGFGDVEWSRRVRPALTTLRLPLADAGLAAADQLLARLAGRSVDRASLVARLIVRGSSGPAPAQ
jgi:LacI family transcriptional regulator